MRKVDVCPGTLKEGFSTYSPACIKNVFGGQRVHHVLAYDSSNNEAIVEKFIENRKRISISGVQEKLSLVVRKKALVLTREDEQGTYILKPIPRDLLNVNEVPANEHLTMQIARQLYHIETAENALVFFRDGRPAYLTKRFDVKTDGRKVGVEDFASLAGKSSHQDGVNFKYDYSYEKLGGLIRQFIPAWRVEIEKYFRLVLFNYLFSNGDAHLKNFSIIETRIGDYKLSPAYDLINTQLHVHDTPFALSKGLFEEDHGSERYKNTGKPGIDDFRLFGRRIGLKAHRMDKLLAPYRTVPPDLDRLIDNSFLSAKSKRAYRLLYDTRRNTLLK